MRLIYGNFGIGSQTVDIFHGAKNLGKVPAMNLLRVRRSTYVRFAGRHWLVKKVSHSGIYLEPSRPTRETVDFSYGGTSSSSDPFSTDRVWRLIHANDLPMGLFTKSLLQHVESFRYLVRSCCTEDQIPYLRSSDGIRYYTFAGYIVNRAVGLYVRKREFKADDLSLLVPSSIDWASIPTQPSGFEDIFHLLYEASTAQSLYQKQLPLDLREREYLQDWLKDATVPYILSRLMKAETKELDNEAAKELGILA